MTGIFSAGSIFLIGVPQGWPMVSSVAPEYEQSAKFSRWNKQSSQHTLTQAEMQETF
jgi:hypothetical protein